MSCLNQRRCSVATLAVLAASATALVVTPVRGADLPVYKALPSALPAIYSWTGFYIGGQIGYAWGHDHTVETLTSSGAPTGLEWRYDLNHIVGGGFLGANYQAGLVVLGLEADLEAAGNEGGFYDPPGAGDTHVKWQGTVRGRIGLAAGRALFYATGGLAYADISHTYTQVVTPISETTAGIRLGWTAGAGVEYALTERLLTRVEYRYTDYGSYKYDSVLAFPGLTGQQEPVMSTLRVGLAYKF
jgi:outer membrane immunogenic protein